MFSRVISFVSNALNSSSVKTSLLSHNATFRKEFQKLVMTQGNYSNVEGFVDVVRLAWAAHLIYTQDHGATMESTLEVIDVIIPEGVLKSLAANMEQVKMAAIKITVRMPIQLDSLVWGALLGARIMHGNVELGERIIDYLFKES
ncbi:hypothetical protein IEQ34_003158 [Dendrobium chrysotoxum]|uniref:Uncharacterized protein n=1 Tax=Dendrobium chrysotoxum TaxID=161865 RepID=A0AAV7HLB7_DENCH|nr:hypothetical protein IEQ34_003158 [Dendrobium chrysotoxum]